jgi:glycosyl transferase family 2
VILVEPDVEYRYALERSAVSCHGPVIYHAATTGAASFAPVSPARATLSACVIAMDEEARLPACLESIAFCDEIVVVDGGSRDTTIEIAERAGARVVRQDWLGFAGQRNVALDNATCDWVLEIDADERVSPELAVEIQMFLENPPAGVDIGAFPRRHRFLGGELGTSAKYPDYRHRLFRRGAYRHDLDRTVHEGIWPRGPVVAFSGDLEHELAGSLGEAWRDFWSYSRAEAAQLSPPRTVWPYLAGMFVRPPVKFAYRLMAGGGWRDGWRGTIHLALAAVSDALVWARALSRRGAAVSAAVPVTPGAHFSGAGAGARSGPPRVVAVAHGAARAEKAARWLERVAGAGLDVALIADTAAVTDDKLRTLEVPGLGPFRLARAVDAEHQLRPIDALVPAGRSERLRLLLVPGSLRGVSGIGLGADPRTIVEAVQDARRPRAQALG